MCAVPLKELILMKFNGIQIPLMKQIYRLYRWTHILLFGLASWQCRIWIG